MTQRVQQNPGEDGKLMQDFELSRLINVPKCSQEINWVNAEIESNISPPSSVPMW
jgi:hypothetical protein